MATLAALAAAPRVNKPLTGLGNFSGDPFPKSTFVSKGRGMGKTQATEDWADAFQQSGRSQFEQEFMPTLYPTLKRRGLIVELTLVDNTPTTCVFDIAALLGPKLKKLDDYRGEFPAQDYDAVQRLLIHHFGRVNEETDADPHAPVTLFVEYCGSCRSHPNEAQARSVICSSCNSRGLARNMLGYTNNCPTCNGQGRVVSTEGDAYASGWVDGGWNVRLSLDVLKKFFGELEKKFNGDFFAALLDADDINRAYKRLARQFHPDLNRARDAVAQFHKLRDAYDALKDPLLRKRYQAGLKFAVSTKPTKDEVLFRVPKTCGTVTVRGSWEKVSNYKKAYWTHDKNDSRDYHQRLLVNEILEWQDIFNEQGQKMEATWAGGQGAYDQGIGAKPFNVTWEDTTEFVVVI